MDSEKSLILDLYIRDEGMHGQTRAVYKVDDKDYQSVLKHIGDIKEGETKLVYEFPEG